jgi:NodT family efflux transporter outer membrane factor (OMF) lipoprotein
MSRIACNLLLALTCAGCSMLWEPVAIPEQSVPTHFDGESAGPSVAAITWREWLRDEDLDRLLAEAVRNNQDLLIALQRVEKTRAGVHAATGALLPQVAAGLGASVEKFGLYTMDGAGNASTDIRPGELVPEPLPDFLIGLQSAWEVDLWGRLRSLRESATAQYLASIDGTNLVLTSLIAEVASAYFDLLALDCTIDVLRRSAAQQTEALEIVQFKKVAGRTNELAVQQFEAQVADTQARERETAQLVVETENRINVLLGRFPQPIPRRKENLLSPPAASLATGVPSDLLRNRPDIRAAERAVRAAEFDVEAARTAFFPSLTITAGAGYEAFQAGLLFNTPESLAYAAAAGMVMPLLNLSALEAQLMAARADQIEAMYEYQRTILVAYTEVVDALSDIRHTDQLLADRARQQVALERSIDTADALYRAGKASYLEVLLAQQNALQAEVDLVEALRRRRVANIAAYRALGGGWQPAGVAGVA